MFVKFKSNGEYEVKDVFVRIDGEVVEVEKVKVEKEVVSIDPEFEDDADLYAYRLFVCLRDGRTIETEKFYTGRRQDWIVARVLYLLEKAKFQDTGMLIVEGEEENIYTAENDFGIRSYSKDIKKVAKINIHTEDETEVYLK